MSDELKKLEHAAMQFSAQKTWQMNGFSYDEQGLELARTRLIKAAVEYVNGARTPMHKEDNE